ncbi:MAG: ABC transporter ATP-binding protein [Acidobacteriia bacterium]|nr:ABC transporter ATP-binding protein [Terriglobia bacterium]
MIQVSDLTKTFRDKSRGLRAVVDHISFEVRDGEIFGLLGPNGAGKTTTLRMLATLLKATSGRAMVGGHEVTADPAAVRRMIGFLSGDMGLYHRLTPREVLKVFGRLNGLRDEFLRTRIDEVVEMLQMRDFADTKVDQLSTGMRQRAALARTLLHDPPVLILDEPTSGLDVPTARVIEEFILQARRSGKCILYSTHVMEEAEFLCDRIAVINQGRIRITGTMSELKAATGRERLREIFLDLLDDQPEKAAAP